MATCHASPSQVLYYPLHCDTQIYRRAQSYSPSPSDKTGQVPPGDCPHEEGGRNHCQSLQTGEVCRCGLTEWVYLASVASLTHLFVVLVASFLMLVSLIPRLYLPPFPPSSFLLPFLPFIPPPPIPPRSLFFSLQGHESHQTRHE